MADAVLFHSGIGDFILATPLSQSPSTLARGCGFRCGKRSPLLCVDKRHGFQ